MQRGDVYRAVLNPVQGSEQAGIRPVVIVSRDAINRSSPVIIVVPLTDKSHKHKIYPSHVELKAGEGGLEKDSVVLCEQVRAISTERLKGQVGHLSNERMQKINVALKIALDLPD